MAVDIERAACLLASPVLIFTGAGISTGSGIPDFRGPQGVWKTKRPVYFNEFLASEEKRIEHWEYKLEGWDAFRQARPNAAHQALAEFDRLGRVNLLVTQNIDGLHHAAGHVPDRIVEIHGTNRHVQCLSCGRLSDPESAHEAFRRTRQCPRCDCGGLLKSATVSFGQPVPPDLLERSLQAAAECASVLAVGSTLSVHPAAAIPLAAARRGRPYVIVNQGDTDHDDLATVRLDGDATQIVPALVEAIQA